MKTNIILLLLLTPVLIFSQSVKYEFTKADNEIIWLAKKVTGMHTGNIYIKNGYLLEEKGQLSTGEFEIDMNSMTCSDLLDAGTNQMLLNHLKSDDFFSVEKYPIAKLKIDKIKKLKDNNYLAVGKITIKGVEQNISFNFIANKSDNKLTAVSKIVIDRTKFGVKYGSGSFFDNLGDNMINDDFELAIKLSSSAK